MNNNVKHYNNVKGSCLIPSLLETNVFNETLFQDIFFQ